MEITKKKLQEIIDSNGELIGSNDIPSTGADLETQAKKTTDYNQKIGTQPFRYDMLGRFGFTMLPFYEGENEQVMPEIINDLANLMYNKYMETLEYYYRNPNKLKSDFRLHSENNFETQPEERRKMDIEWAKKIIAVVEPYLENNKNKPENIDESKVSEDKVVDKKTEDEMSKKSEDNDIREKKLEKIAGLINKLEKSDIDKLINLLERKE